MRTYVRRPKPFKAFCWDGTAKSIEKNLGWSDIKKYFNIEVNRECNPGPFFRVHEVVSEKTDLELRHHNYSQPILKGDYIIKTGHGFKVVDPATFYRDFKEV